MASGPRYAGASGSKSLGAKGMRAFTELYELHSGRHSTVWSARLVDDPDTVVVIKAYPKLRSKPRQLRSVTKELQLLRLFTRTRTEGVSHLVCSFEEDETVFLIFEACLHGDLYQLLARHKGQLTEEFVVEQVVVPLLRTLAHIHKLCLVHRDIKPENVFINSDGDMILGDFGLAAHTVHDTLTERVGTLDYMAPEVLAMPTLEEQAARPRTLQPYDEKVDVWAMGILVYELLCGSPPFEVDDPLETAHLIMQTSVNSFPESMSAECKSFIQLALKKDPKERPSAQALIFHPWVMECMEGDLPPPSCPESATKALKRIVHASWNITDLNNLLETVVPLPPGVDREAGASNRDCLTRLPSMNSHSRSLTTDDEKCFDYYSDSEESSWSREPSKTLLSPSSGTLLSARPSASGYSLSREPLPKLDELTVVSLAEASKEGGGGDQSPPQPPPKRGPPTQHRDPSRSSPHSSPQTKDHSLFSSEIQPLIEGFEALLNNTKRTQVGGTGGSTNKPQVAGFRGIPNLHSASPMDPPLTLSRPSTSCREAPSATKAMPSEGNLDSSSTKASSPTRVQPFPAPPTLATSAPCDADPCPSPSSSSPTALGKPQPVAESTQSNMTIKFPLHIHLHKASSFLPEATSFSPYSCSPAMIRCGGGSSGGTSYQIPGSGYSEGSTLDGILHRCISSPTRHHAIDEHTPAFSPFANQQAKASNPALSVETNAYRNTQGPFPMAKRPMESTKTDLSVETNAYRNTQGPFSSMAKQPTESTKTDLSVETNAYRNTQGPFSSMAKQPTESTRTDLSSQTSAGRNTEGQSPPGPDTTFTIQDPQSWYSFTASMESSTITGLSSSSGMPAPGMLKGSGCCPAADSAGFVIKPGCIPSYLG